jgi:hypothetical protein
MNRTKLSLLVAIVTVLATSLPASAQLSSGEVNLIGIGASIVNSLINPPHRDAEIKAEAEVKKAKIAAEAEIAKEKLRLAADKVTPVLNQWGVSRVSCAPGLVFINGIDANTVCLQPSGTLAAGYYTYNNEKSQLIRTGGAISQTTQSIGTGGAISQTTQSIRTTTRLTTNGNARDNGF